MPPPHWVDRLIDDAAGIDRLLRSTRRIAVLGIKTGSAIHQAAYYVPSYLANAGFEIIPVPVYYPDAIRILDRPVVRRLRDIPGTIDLVDIFRRPESLPDHLEDLLTARPTAVWLQRGIRNDRFAETLARAGILVVQDRCIMVEHRRLSW